MKAMKPVARCLPEGHFGNFGFDRGNWVIYQFRKGISVTFPFLFKRRGHMCLEFFTRGLDDFQCRIWRTIRKFSKESIKEHNSKNFNELTEAIMKVDQHGGEKDGKESATYSRILKECGAAKALCEGRWVHGLICRDGLLKKMYLGNHLIDMYRKCGSVSDACNVFDAMVHRNLISWTNMIAAFTDSGRLREALELFHDSFLRHMQPDKVVFVSILSACNSWDALQEGRLIHAYITGYGFGSDIIISNALISMYSRCSSLKDAVKIFEDMPERQLVSWTALIDAYSHHGHADEAHKAFRMMKLEGHKPNKVTFITILNACSCLETLADGKFLHASILDNNFQSDIVVGTAIVNMYSRCGRLEDAQKIFFEMQNQDEVLCNTMIAAYARHEHHVKDALRLFWQMNLQGLLPDASSFVAVLSACDSLLAAANGKLIHAYMLDGHIQFDVYVWTSLLNMYSKCGSLEDACTVFYKMKQRNVVTWNAMLAAYVDHGHELQALQFFEDMQVITAPDKVTFISVLEACANQAALKVGMLIHECVADNGLESDIMVQNALVNMYGKCGALGLARKVFWKMPSKDLVTWNALLGAYAIHGDYEEMSLIFQKMHLDQNPPNRVTFTSILSSCSHAGLGDEGCHYFVYMGGNHCIPPGPEHYGCVIDLLGRAGQIVEAQDFIQTMLFEVDAVSWSSLLGSCILHDDVGGAKQVAKCLLELDFCNTGAYTSMLNIYAGEELRKVKHVMRCDNNWLSLNTSGSKRTWNMLPW